MDIFKNSFYIRSNKYLSFYGHWPYMDTKIKIINQILIMSIILSVFLPQSAMMFEIRHYFHYFILSIPSQLYYTQFLAKNVFAFLGRKKIEKVLENIKRDFQIYKGEDLKVLHDYSNGAERFNYCYTVYMFMVVSAYSLLPLSLHVMDIFMPLNGTLRLEQKPRLIKYYISSLDNNMLFIILHGSLADLMAIVFVIGFDTLYLSFAYHVCALFVILAKKVQDAVNIEANLEIDTIDPKSKENQDIYYRNFVKAIVMHQYVLESIQTIESAFTILNLLSIGCAMIPLTITGFEALLNKDNPGEMMRFLLYAFAEIVHLFYYNWPGQKIRDHSMLIYQSCYNCEWYKQNFSIKSKKIMNLMMVRSQKPSNFTAGKVYVLGLENFAAVMKLSMSYFTVLSTIM